MSDIDNDFNDRIQKGLKLPSEKKIYFNAFTMSINNSDFALVLQLNDEPILFLNCSHSVAKSMSKVLKEVINNFEEGTSIKILSLDEYPKPKGKTTPSTK